MPRVIESVVESSSRAKGSTLERVLGLTRQIDDKSSPLLNPAFEIR